MIELRNFRRGWKALFYSKGKHSKQLPANGGTDNILNLINICVFILGGGLNTITGILKNQGLFYYIYYVGPFIIFPILLFLINSKKLTAGIYLFIGTFATLSGHEGNATGAIFFLFAIYLLNNYKINILIAIITILSITTKFSTMGLTIPETLSLLIAYAYIFLIYYYLIHPKKPVIKTNIICKELDLETINILHKLYNGENIKTISEEIYLTTDAIAKRIARAKETMNAKSRDHLLAICQKRGYIWLNMDKAT